MKNITVDENEWEMVLQINIKCPYCNKEIKVCSDEDEIDSVKVKCVSCNKHFYIHTNQWRKLK